MNRPSDGSWKIGTRGFTLMEVIIAMTMMATVLTVTMSIVVTTITDTARSRMYADLIRQSMFVSTTLNQELGEAGVGVPDNVNIDGTTGSFDTAVILATPTAVGIVADLPRPGRQYNTFGLLDPLPTGDTLHVFWHTENNGGCRFDNVGTCTPAGNVSRFFTSTTPTCSTGVAESRTCPWGMRRLTQNEWYQIAAGDGRWWNAKRGAPANITNTTAGLPTQLAMTNTSAWPVSSTPPWNNVQNTDHPVGARGQGFVSTVDRVFFYWSENATLHHSQLRRVQCWGPAVPKSSNWPDLLSNPQDVATVPFIESSANSASGECATTVCCTGPEVIARNVNSIVFKYYGANNNLIPMSSATASRKAEVRRIDYFIEFKRKVPGKEESQSSAFVNQYTVGTVLIRHPISPP